MAAKFSRLRTIYWRQFFLTAGMVFLSLMLLGAAFFSLGYNYISNEKKAELQGQTDLLAQFASQYISNGKISQDQTFRVLTRFAGSIADMDLFVYDLNGQALLTSSSTLLALEGQQIFLPSAITEKVLAGENYSGLGTLGGLYQQSMFLLATPITDPASGVIVGMVIGASDTGILTDMLRSFLTSFWVVAATILMLTFVAVAFATMQQTRPIKEMVRATKLYAEGNLDVRVDSHGRQDEIGELADSFNSMADSLQETERQRRDFIANISHELKTPMTTIAGYTDGILDGTIPPEKERQYLQIISDESRRLSRLVRRMLDVSQIQALDKQHLKDRFDLGESMRQVLISLEQRITMRQLDVEVDIPEAPVLVVGDRVLITQVVYNLLENASKFATGGSVLYLRLLVENGRAQVTVRNHGETISPEELPLLFERFHKTDKSRSEDKDGVGLGLYIVKTILEQHGEKISASSENGLTTFRFSLPLSE